MSKGHSLQDPYLNTLRKERVKEVWDFAITVPFAEESEAGGND